jgi:hypothetical protein
MQSFLSAVVGYDSWFFARYLCDKVIPRIVEEIAKPATW